MSTPIIWFTGLSLSGKTTLAEGLVDALRRDGHRVEVLDGKVVRDELAGFFGYSREERIKVSRLLATMARLLARHGVVPVVTSITPYEESREFNRRELGNYLEIFVDCPVETCMERDPQGLYRRAMRGDLRHFVGVDDPYELPRRPDLTVRTAGEPAADSIRRVREFVAGAIASMHAEPAAR